MKKILIFMLSTLALLAAGCASSDPSKVEPQFILYTRADVVQSPKKEIYTSYRSLLMTSDGIGIQVLEWGLDGIVADWQDGGRIIVVGLNKGTAEKPETHLRFWNIKNHVMFRLNAVNNSADDLMPERVLNITIQPECKYISQLAWGKDMRTVHVLCTENSESTKYQLCQVKLIAGESQVPITLKSIQCENLTDILKTDIKRVYSMDRSPLDDRIIFGLSTGQSPSDFSTYLYDVPQKTSEYLFAGLGSAWSPDGTKIAATDIPDHEGCLTEVDLATKALNELYCPVHPLKEDSFKYSLRAYRYADYSPDGQYVIFVANRDFVYPDSEFFDIYRMDLTSKNIEMLTVFGDGNAYFPKWQPK